MASRHATKYRDSSSNIKVLLRQQTNMTLNDRFHKIMKMPAPQQRPRTPPKDTRIREELRAHQRKLETLERNTLSMMSRSLASLSTATASASTIPVPTAPVYEPPKPSAKARLGVGGRNGTVQSRIGAKRLTQKYSTMQRNKSVSVPGGRYAAGRLSRGGNTTGRGATRTTRGGANSRGGATKRGGASTRGGATTRGGARGGGNTRGGGAGRGGANKKPDKDALDTELEKYMSKSKAYLDNQLDSYMAQKGDKEAAS